MKGSAGEVYNLGTATEIRNIDLARMLIGELGLDDSYLEYVADRLGHDQRYSLNVSKSKTNLGFEPSIEFQIGLKETITWYREFYASPSN